MKPTTPWLPELLAPAGDWDCVKAAVENGADAIYFGLDRFNARMRAQNFTETELPSLMAFLHRRGVRGYLSFNTLVFSDELAEAERFLRSMITTGVDAAIVQDVGICRLIRRLSPDFPIHASTQMTITSAAGVQFARELGCDLVVLARECSLKDLEAIQTAPSPDGSGLPLEVFVHGALCVAYSGQCLTSESLGGRSANRGECAQACRLPYELVSDGQTVPLGDRRYLLSPQDLAGVDLLPELARLGIASLKIEGRLKSPEYVASITRIYRRALDGLAASGVTHRMLDAGCQMPDAGCQMPLVRPAEAHPISGIRDLVSGIAHSAAAIADPTYEMQMAFSRGLHTGWFRGINNQQLVHARYPKKRGVFLGTVVRVLDGQVELQLEGPLKPGDGVVFDSGRPDEREEGGRVYEVRRAKGGARSPQAEGRRSSRAPANQKSEIRNQKSEALLSFRRGALDFRRIRSGDRVWKTSDPELERELRSTFEGDQPYYRRPIAMEVSGRAEQPLVVRVGDEDGRVTEARSSVLLAAATTRPLTTERLREQLGRLGGTPFRLHSLSNRIEGEVMLPIRELNQIRRALVADLERQRITPRRWTLSEPVESRPSVVEAVRSSDAAARAQHPVQLRVLVRQLDQLAAALAAGVELIYCEFEDPKRYREAVQTVRDHRAALPRPPAHDDGSGGPRCGPARGPFLFVAPPRITKPGEEWILRQVRSSDADGYLVRNYDQLQFFRGCRCVGDYTLNVANPLAAEYFISQFGLERLTASYDLNAAQLDALLSSAPPAWFEITIHQHMPMFHMEHCVFCAFLSQGTDYTNCGRPCDRHAVQLRDRVGALHPLKADAGCRNTVFNALAQTGAAYVGRFRALGARQFRLEFLGESRDVVTRTIARYRQLLAGTITGGQLWRELRLEHQLGVTRGPLDRGERPVTVL